MRLSKIGFKSFKIANLDEMFPAQDILYQTGQLVQYESGIYGYDNIPFLVQRNIEKIICEELNKIDCVQVSLPVMQPDELWKSSGRWDKYVEDGTMFVVETKKGSYGLAPTAEEAIVKFARKRLTSYKNLPVTFYQIGEKFRNELRPRGYLLRTKSFLMMDAYSFGNELSDLEKTYDVIKEAYLKIFERLGLKVMAVVADNGAIGGKKSEEFMLLSDNGEDTILVDKVTGIGLNKEILEKDNYQEYLKSEYGITDLSNLEEKKALELGHVFQLGTTYSTAMNAMFTDKDGVSKPYYMGCYGIGVSRVMAMIYEKNIITSEKGIEGVSLPLAVTPYLIYIISKSDDEEKTKEANNIYESLVKAGVTVILDDRDVTIGSKIKDCKILGVPYMTIIGDNATDKMIEIEKTSDGTKTVLGLEQVVDFFKNL